jgi:hypothetical protein
MKVLTRFLAVSLCAIFASSAFAAEPLQFWHCEMQDEASEDDVLNGVGDWLDAAKKVPGGESLDVKVLFPVVVNSVGDYDVWFALSADSFEAWGKFWDNYPESDAGEIEDANAAFFICPDSVLFHSESLED